MTDPASRPAPPAPPAAPAAAAPSPGARPEGHPAAPVFHPGAFVVVLIGVVASVATVPAFGALFQSRLALPGALATGCTAAAAALVAVALGGLAGWLFRRLAFYEVFAASLVWILVTTALVLRSRGAIPPVPPALMRPGLVAEVLVLVAVAWLLRRRALYEMLAAGLVWVFLSLLLLQPTRAATPPVLEGLASQGTLVLTLALLGLGALATTAAFVGSSFSYLLAGTGRVDPSFSYELYVARSHLRLNPRTLGALFGMVLIGIVPGILVLVIWSFVRDAEERAAYRRGELVSHPRMPATMLMTLISIAGVAIGVSALIVVLSVMSGFSADLKKKILGHNAHGMLLSYGQEDFGDWHAVRKKTLEVPGVAGATPFLYNEVILTTGENLTGAVLKGVDVPTLGTVTDLPTQVVSGDLDWLVHPEKIPPPSRAGDATPPAAASRALPGIVLGRELAHSLRVYVGDQVNVVSPLGDLGPAGPQPKSRPFRVAGVFFSGMYEYDSKMAYIDLGEAQRFFGSDTVTGLEIKVHNPDAARAVLDQVIFALGGWPYRARDWSELNRTLFAALQQEKVVMAVILGCIVAVAALTIFATLIMMVLEKRREIAVLRSMGAVVPSVMRIFVVEGVVIGAVGALFGLLLGLGVCLFIDKVGIPLNPEIYYIDNLPVVVDGSQLVLVTLAALVLSYLATIYPAAKAARLHPVDGLRSE